jgi:hypothetical protein
MAPEKVPAAAALLAEYGSVFEQLEDRAWEAAKEVRALVKALE